MKQWFTAMILFIIAGVIAACSSSATPAEVAQAQPEGAQVESEAAQAQPAAPVFATQSNNEQAVTVEVTPLNLAEGRTTLEFEVAFNTHSVDLGFDPAALSILRDGQGQQYPATAWKGDPAGGHHRSGTLQFELPNLPTDSIEVVIRDVAGVPERVFQWDLVKK